MIKYQIVTLRADEHDRGVWLGKKSCEVMSYPCVDTNSKEIVGIERKDG